LIYIRYYGDSEGVPAYEMKLVDKRYSIPGSATSMTIEINGYEDVLPFSLSELLTVHAMDTKAKDICDHNKYLWGVNWKGRNPHNELLKSISEKIEPELKIKYIEDNGYNDPNNVSQYVGYFRTESYPFAAEWYYKDGTISEKYPIKGYDFLEDKSLSNGIIRFPSKENYPLEAADNKVAVLGLRMSIDHDYLNSLTDEQKEWLSQNIIGFKILRGERYKNHLYEGYSMRMYGRDNSELIFRFYHKAQLIFPFYHKGYKCYCKTVQMKSNNVSIPIYGNEDKDMMPTIQVNYDDDENPYEYSLEPTIEFQTYTRTEFEKKLMALMSPDFILQQHTPNENIGCICSYATTYEDSDFTKNNDIIIPSKIRIGIREVEYGATPLNKTIEEWEKVGEDYIADPVNKSPKLSCINRAYDALTNPNNAQRDTTKDYSLFYKYRKDAYGIHDSLISNRNLYVPKYLAFKLSDPLYDRIVTAFITEPNLLKPEDLFTPANTEYFEITNLIGLYTRPFDVFQGDCFVQRTYFKIMSWEPSKMDGWDYTKDAENDEYPYSPFDNNMNEVVGMRHKVDAKQEPDTGIKYTYTAAEVRPSYYMHGRMISIVTQNAVNTAFREEGDHSTYYPKVKYSHTSHWEKFPFAPWGDNHRGPDKDIVEMPGFESYLYNAGYNANPKLKRTYGFDPLTVKEGEWINKPGRIRYTAKDVSGSFFDS
jgi:hypothetical protein